MNKKRFREMLPGWSLRNFRVIREVFRLFTRKVTYARQKSIYRELILSRINLNEINTSQLKVLDLGANIGHFTDACRELGFTVVAVEPHPDAISRLQKRFKGDKKVEIHRAGVGKTSGFGNLQLHPDHANDPIATSIRASLINDKFQSGNPSIKIPIISLESLFKESPGYFIVKIDIEGYEMNLVDNLICHSNKIEYLLMETHTRFMKDSAERREYEKSIQKLENFISTSNLSDKWFTDWI